MRVYVISILWAALCVSVPAYAQEAREEGGCGGSTFTFFQENDIYTGSDRDYTNGTRISWISPDLSSFRDDPRLPSWSHGLIDALPFTDGESFLKTVSLSVGQNIYTPEDIDGIRRPGKDRPYAGISYLAFGFHSRNTRVMNTWEYSVGIIGPHSYAEDMQKAVHEWTNSDSPNGWEDQIRDEPILNVFYDRKWRIAPKHEPTGLSYDAIPHAGCAVGNALTEVTIGGQVRMGRNLPNDFGTLPIQPASDTNAPFDEQDPRLSEGSRRFSSVHAFVSVDTYAKLWDITLDGNFLRRGNGSEVDKEPFVAQLAGGIGITTGRFKITYAYVTRTREYETQNKRQAYGAVTVSYTLR